MPHCPNLKMAVRRRHLLTIGSLRIRLLVIIVRYHRIPGLQGKSKGQCVVYSFGINDDWTFDKVSDLKLMTSLLNVIRPRAS